MGKTYDILIKGDAINETIAMHPFTWFPLTLTEDLLHPIQIYFICNKLILEYKEKIEIRKKNYNLRILKENLIHEVNVCSDLNQLYLIIEKLYFIVKELNNSDDDESLLYLQELVENFESFQTFLLPYLSDKYLAEISY